MIILTGVILLFARTMRVEAESANNRVSAVQAAAIVRGAEQYVLALVESAAGDPSAIVDAPAEAMQVGEDPYDRRPLGYFWLIKPDPGNTERTAFGLVDENSKIDLGSAPPEELLRLPGMTNDVADAIVDWRDPDATVTNQGAENEYYMSLPQPYNAKNDVPETVEELRLVKGMTQEILYGWDRNRDGVLDAREREWGGTATAFNAATGAGRGIAPFVTVYSAEPAAAAGTGLADVNGDAQALQTAMAQTLAPDRVTAILQRAGVGGGGGGGGPTGGGGQPVVAASRRRPAAAVHQRVRLRRPRAA
jgi:DNA uptake protein ComE-like DNA-binding protein